MKLDSLVSSLVIGALIIKSIKTDEMSSEDVSIEEPRAQNMEPDQKENMATDNEDIKISSSELNVRKGQKSKITKEDARMVSLSDAPDAYLQETRYNKMRGEVLSLIEYDEDDDESKRVIREARISLEQEMKMTDIANNIREIIASAIEFVRALRDDLKILVKKDKHRKKEEKKENNPDEKTKQSSSKKSFQDYFTEFSKWISGLYKTKKDPNPSLESLYKEYLKISKEVECLVNELSTADSLVPNGVNLEKIIEDELRTSHDIVFTEKGPIRETFDMRKGSISVEGINTLRLEENAVVFTQWLDLESDPLEKLTLVYNQGTSPGFTRKVKVAFSTNEKNNTMIFSDALLRLGQGEIKMGKIEKLVIEGAAIQLLPKINLGESKINEMEIKQLKKGQEGELVKYKTVLDIGSIKRIYLHDYSILISRILKFDNEVPRVIEMGSGIKSVGNDILKLDGGLIQLGLVSDLVLINAAVFALFKIDVRKDNRMKKLRMECSEESWKDIKMDRKVNLQYIEEIEVVNRASLLLQFIELPADNIVERLIIKIHTSTVVNEQITSLKWEDKTGEKIGTSYIKAIEDIKSNSINLGENIKNTVVEDYGALMLAKLLYRVKEIRESLNIDIRTNNVLREWRKLSYKSLKIGKIKRDPVIAQKAHKEAFMAKVDWILA